MPSGPGVLDVNNMSLTPCWLTLTLMSGDFPWGAVEGRCVGGWFSAGLSCFASSVLSFLQGKNCFFLDTHWSLLLLEPLSPHPQKCPGVFLTGESFWGIHDPGHPMSGIFQSCFSALLSHSYWLSLPSSNLLLFLFGLVHVAWSKIPFSIICATGNGDFGKATVMSDHIESTYASHSFKKFDLKTIDLGI